MNQETMRELLEEASSPSCSLKRKEQIGSLITGEVCVPDDSLDSLKLKEKLSRMVNTVYKETMTRDPSKLPQLLPVFALICDDCTKIEWKVLG
jgi:hypothetical protein